MRLVYLTSGIISDTTRYDARCTHLTSTQKWRMTISC